MPVILVSITDPSLCGVVSTLKAGLPPDYQVRSCPLPTGSPRNIPPYDLLVIQCSVHDGGLDQVEYLRQHGRTAPIVVMGTETSEALAIRSIKLGVKDYLKVPAHLDQLLATVNRVLGRTSPKRTNDHGDPVMIGASEAITAVRQYLGRVALTDTNVLITGETGTGKELVAQAIHRKSSRAGGPFLCVNCAAIPDGLIESELFGYERGAFTGAASSQPGLMRRADGGTIFFDEVGDMSPLAQSKVLRALETREVYPLAGRRSYPVNLRVIAATNQDLNDPAGRSHFRADLFFRLAVARIQLPALRERLEDIPLLVQHFIEEFNRRLGRAVTGLTTDAYERLMNYDWPGNIRELRNAIEAVFINLPEGAVSAAALPEHLHRACDSALPPDERSRLVAALFAANWNISKAAEALNWSRMTVYRKLAKYAIGKERTMRSGSL